MKTDKEQIRNALLKFEKHVPKQQWDELDHFVSDKWKSFAAGSVVEWEEQKKMMAENYSDHSSDFSNFDIHVSNDGSMAWCFAEEQTEYTFQGEQVEEEAIFTTIWEKEEGTWKLVHLNRSVNPAHMPDKMKKAMAEHA